MKKLLNKAGTFLRTKVGQAVTAIAMTSVSAAASAQATLDADVQAVFTELGETAGLLITAAIGLMAVIMGGTMLIRLSKKFIGIGGR